MSKKDNGLKVSGAGCHSLKALITEISFIVRRSMFIFQLTPRRLEP
jgi:hypothetical protein